MSVAQTFTDALGRLETDGDAQPIASLFAPDGRCENVVTAHDATGPEGAERFWEQDRALFDDVRSEFRSVVEDDDHVALEWTRKGTRHGSPVRFDVVSVLELDDGRISRFKAYFDPRAIDAD